MTCSESKLLLVDDDESIRISLSAFFEDHGWEVLPSISGEAALTQQYAQSASAAIVDARMGGMTGDEFIRAAMRLNPRLVFLVCTGSLDYQIPPDLIKSPRVCSRVFRKPLLHILELKAALEALLETAYCEER